jgi:hypothetical protein
VSSVYGRTGAVVAVQDDYFPTQLGCSYSVSTATLTLFPNASASKPCTFGGVQKTAPVTVTVSSASTTGTARVFVDVTGAVQVYYNTGATLTCGAGGTCTSGQAAFPETGELPLFTPTWTASNTWDAYAAANDLRSIMGSPRTFVCTGCSATSYTNGGRTFNFTASSASIASTSSVLKGDGAGAAVAATAGTDYTTPSSTETMSNKTHSWASNAFGLRDWNAYRLAVCRGGGAGTATLGDAVSTPSSGAATAVCLGGTNQVMGGLRFSDSATNEAQITYQMSDDDNASQSYYMLWKTSATSGAVKWQVSQACITVGSTGTIDIAWEHTPTTTTSVLAAANAVQQTIVSGGNNGCGSGQLKTIRIFRDPADAADTASADVDLLTFNIYASRTQ